MAAPEGVDWKGTILPYAGKSPVIHPSVFIAHGSVIVGDVVIGKESSVWFNAVIRGDVHFIRIGERTNVQDGSILHVTHDTYSLAVGSHVTIGHGAILHGCTIYDHCLLGMGSRVLDGSVVEPFSMVAAGALVKEHQVIPEGSLAVGVPARIVRKLSDDERAALTQSAMNYCRYVNQYRAHL